MDCAPSSRRKMRRNQVTAKARYIRHISTRVSHRTFFEAGEALKIARKYVRRGGQGRQGRSQVQYLARHHWPASPTLTPIFVYRPRPVAQGWADCARCSICTTVCSVYPTHPSHPSTMFVIVACFLWTRDQASAEATLAFRMEDRYKCDIHVSSAGSSMGRVYVAGYVLMSGVTCCMWWCWDKRYCLVEVLRDSHETSNTIKTSQSSSKHVFAS